MTTDNSRDSQAQQRRRQDRTHSDRPLVERILLLIVGLAVLAAAVAGVWWLWTQSGAGRIVRDDSPNWSADSREVIFSSESGGKAELFVADRTGANRHQLTFTPGDEGGAAYAPASATKPPRIAFHSDRDGNVEIYVMAASGESARRLTDNPGRDMFPAWSPDGAWIIFMSDRSNPEFDLYRMHDDGTGVEAVTKGGSNWFPQYAPDGVRVALHKGRDLYILNLQTRGFHRLTYEPMNGMAPTWSPDGRQIAFMSWRNGKSEVFIEKSDGSEPQVLVTMPRGDAINPRWSPDGLFIAFVHLPEGGASTSTNVVGQRVVFVVEISTGRVTRISR